MDILWSRPGSSIREVQTALEQDKDVNFNTVMTVMNRLVDKGLLGKSQRAEHLCTNRYRVRRSL